MEAKPDNFCYLLRVRYLECDAQKVAFNGRYVDYIDIAVTEYMREVWGDYNALMESGMDQQVVNVQVSWKAPAHFDDVLALYIGLKKLGNTSYTLDIQYYNYKSGQQLAEGEITYVMVKTPEFEKIPIPDHLRHQLEAGAPGVQVDHAGVNIQT